MGGNVLAGSEIQAVHGRVNRNHHFAQDIRKGPSEAPAKELLPRLSSEVTPGYLGFSVPQEKSRPGNLRCAEQP